MIDKLKDILFLAGLIAVWVILVLLITWIMTVFQF